MATSVNPTLKHKQQETVNDVHRLLNEYGKCIMIRPTGFGKTYLLVEKFTKSFLKNNANKGKKVLYVYPLDIIKTEILEGKKSIDENGVTHIEKSKYLKDGVIKSEKTHKDNKNQNVIFMSYQNITMQFNDDNDFLRKFIIDNNIGLIILDEAHRAGSDAFEQQYATIQDLIGPDKVWLLGATATPNRMDDSNEKLPIIERIFDNKQPFEYGLNEAFRDKLIPEIIYMADQYTIKEQSDKTRKAAKDKFGDEFDENSFNIEIARLREETGAEPDVIAKAINLAGYNPVKDKYYKFIVFFTSIQDMIDQAEETERWFNEAFNNQIKATYGLQKTFDIRTYLITSSDGTGELSQIASKGNNRQRFNSAKKVSEIVETAYCVDLLFTVNMINMGYHVDNITGIMMRRGTKSEITYYQQLGRALSVNAVFHPIVIDCVNNIGENFWSKKNAKERLGKNTDGTPVETVDKEESSLGIDVTYVNSLNSFRKFLERFDCSDNMVERLKLDFLYNDRHMPLYIIASHLSISCRELKKKMIKYQIKIRQEDEEYKRVLNNCRIYDKKSDKASKERFELEKLKLRFINSKDANYGRCEYITNKDTTTMYNLMNDKRLGGNRDA